MTRKEQEQEMWEEFQKQGFNSKLLFDAILLAADVYVWFIMIPRKVITRYQRNKLHCTILYLRNKNRINLWRLQRKVRKLNTKWGINLKVDPHLTEQISKR